MSACRQFTIASPVVIDGVGLHTGCSARLTLRPGSPDSGIVFFRTDGDPQRIDATPETVFCTRLGTSVKNQSGSIVRTIEHLMAALAICRIDNAFIDISGEEAPILDGSAALFVSKIESAGRLEQAAPRIQRIITEPIELNDGDRFIRATPYAGRRMDISISFEDPAIGDQAISIDLDNDAAIAERLAQARTFCRLSDVENLRAAGFGLGGSFANSIVVDGASVLNENGLRDSQEFVLHKALDLFGDLRLAAPSVIGHIEAHKCGHDLNTAFAKLIAENCPLVTEAASPAVSDEVFEEALSLTA